MKLDKYSDNMDGICSADLMEDVNRCLMAMKGRNSRRERCKRYAYGDQWKDVINADGREITEEQYIIEQGNIPLKNNLIRRIVRNVLGVFRDSLDSREFSDSRLAASWRRNGLADLYARTMEDFLIGGMAVHRKWFGMRGGKEGCWTRHVSPDTFFMTPGSRDCRGWDVETVGEVHDVSFGELLTEFAGTEAQAARLRALYPPSPGNRCRVVEVWRREVSEEYVVNDMADGSLRFMSPEDFGAYSRRMPQSVRYRWRTVMRWRYCFMTPDGTVLREGDSPYRHGMHPYVLRAYPFIDGEVHSFVGDLIDQQRYTNRLITLYDWVIRSSAKGVLLFPDDALPEGFDLQTVADEWSRHNGVIVYTPRPGSPLPQQVSGNARMAGVGELLEIQMKMLEDVSGVNGALQGKLDSNTTSGTLYDRQTRNALTALRDLLDTFDSFISSCDDMELSLLRQQRGAVERL